MPIVETPPGMIARVAASAVLIGAALTAMHLAPAPTPPYKMVDQVAFRPAFWEGQRLSIHGYVVAGTIVDVTPNIHGFVLMKNGARLRVWYDGELPDTFRDQSEAVVSGTLRHEDDGWLFDASQLSTKCGGKYEGGPREKSTKFE